MSKSHWFWFGVEEMPNCRCKDSKQHSRLGIRTFKLLYLLVSMSSWWWIDAEFVQCQAV